jgi:hypothetical protein
MKTLKCLIALFALSLFAACSGDYVPGQETDHSAERDLLKSQLIGEWVIAGQKSSYIYAFADDDTIYIKTQASDTISKWPYQAIAADSIRIIRNGITHNKVVFYSGDSIRINDFIPDIAAVYPPQFGDAALKRWLNGDVFPVEINPVLIGKGEITYWEGFTVPKRVITSVEEWNELKTSMRNRVHEPNTFDESDIDFSAYQVIAVFDEIRTSGGWSIDITGIVEYSDKIVVSVTNLKTGGQTTVMTQPYHIVKIPVSDKEIVFQKEDDGYNGEPKEVSFTAYSLAGTSCQWIKLDVNDNDEVVVINSDEELNRHITCTGNDYPAVDFSKYTLLLAHGLGSSSVVSVNCNSLQKFSEQSYKMNVDLSLGYATVVSYWQVPIIVNKLSEGCTVELTVTIK